MLAILITTLVAIYSIRKTAEANRISNIHLEMASCLIDTISILREAICLLEDIANHVVYNQVPEGKILETAYSRYWKNIKYLSEQFIIIQAKQKLVFPKELYEKIQELIGSINSARKLAKEASPNENNIYPDTRELKNIVNDIALKYRNFIHCARCYLGTDTITPILKKGDEILKSIEDKKINNP